MLSLMVVAAVETQVVPNITARMMQTSTMILILCAIVVKNALKSAEMIFKKETYYGFIC
jgi:hypothetical protein